LAAALSGEAIAEKSKIVWQGQGSLRPIFGVGRT